MTTTTTQMLIRVLPAAIALTLIWVCVSLSATPLALILGIIASVALAVATFGDLLVRTTPKETTVPGALPAAHLGEASTILELLDDAVLSYDASFKVTFANQAAADLFGVSRETLMTTTVLPQLAQQTPSLARLVQVVYPSLAPTVIPRSERSVDLAFTDPELHLRVHTLPLGEHGFLKVIRDRTRQVAIVRSKGEFVTVASHQLRTPLTEVSWALETLAGSPTIDADNKALATQTLESVKSLIRTAEDLLGTAKIEEGRFGYRFAQADIVQLLDTELAKAMPVVEAAGLKLYFDRPTSALPPVYMDMEKVAMVINNLVENAMRYNTTNGEITVRAEALPDEPFVKVSVKDTGIGIAPSDVDKLFTKFFRAENAVKAVAGGTGLGLYILNNIIRGHGGQVGVSSELGRGSTFWFTLTTDQRRVPQHEVAEDVA